MKSYIFYIILLILVFKRKILAGYHQGEHENNSTSFKFLVQGGYRPEKHNYAKYLVSIRFGKDYSYFGSNHMCGGTIIKPDAILTAAHCVYRQLNYIYKIDGNFFVTFSFSLYRPGPKKLLFKAWQLHVVAGTVNRLQATSTTEVIKVKNIIANPLYNIEHIENDVAILKLKHAIYIDGKTRAVMNIMDRPIAGYTQCLIAGWGRLYFNGPMPAEVVYADLFALPTLDCKLKIHVFYREGMICADDESDLEKSGCMGDSGGPLFCDNKIAGIVSFGINYLQCGGDKPTIFADVFHYRDWIIENSTPTKHISQAVVVFLIIIAFINFLYTSFR